MNIAPIRRFTNRNALRIKKNSPQILFYAGIVGTVATTVLASRATLKAVPVVEKLKSERDELDSFHLEDKIDPDLYNREVYRQYTEAGVALTRLYGPTVLIGVGSLVALTRSHQQLNSRNTALTVAYTGLFKTFESYRDRVRAELGEDRDREFLHGTVDAEVEYEDKNGRKRTKTVATLDPSSKSALHFMYDANCASWCKDPGYNQNFLDNLQTWFNIILKQRGHITLNDVYDKLLVPRIPEGQVLGWVYQDLGDNDMYVSFGHQKDGEFVAGFKRDVMLEFNIHGPILELI